MNDNTNRQGIRSHKIGHLGVYFICTGPDPKGPAPGERLIIVIYDKQDKIVRRLEQVRGACLDPGYVDFFLSNKCRPARYILHIIDIDQDGQSQILATHTSPKDAYEWLVENVSKWAEKHGVPQ